MKIRYQILIILFIFASFIFVKDDVKHILNNNIFNSSKKSGVNLSGEISYSKQTEPLKLEVDTPGALKVSDNFLGIKNGGELSAKKIIASTNEQRKDNGGLVSLHEQEKLNQSATKKLQDMFNNQYFEHESPEGLGVGDLGEQSGYDYILIGENLAMGNFKDDSALVSAWMASEGHRKNILNKNYTDIGVAVGRGQYMGKNTWMAVQHFGTPQNVCPNIDKVLLGMINLNQTKIIELSNNLSIRRDNIEENIIFEGSTINEQIDEYNQLVNIYNELINQTKIETDQYNLQVKTFNTCVLNYQ